MSKNHFAVRVTWSTIIMTWINNALIIAVRKTCNTTSSAGELIIALMSFLIIQTLFLYHLFKSITFKVCVWVIILWQINAFKHKEKLMKNKVCIKHINHLHIVTILLLFYCCYLGFVDYFIVIWFRKIQYYIQRNPKYPINYNPKSLIINTKIE